VVAQEPSQKPVLTSNKGIQGMKKPRQGRLKLKQTEKKRRIYLPALLLEVFGEPLVIFPNAFLFVKKTTAWFY
jgi:hypothetical protein